MCCVVYFNRIVLTASCAVSVAGLFTECVCYRMYCVLCDVCPVMCQPNVIFINLPLSPSSIMQGSVHSVQFHLPDSARVIRPLSSSSSSKTSPAYALSPFLSFCLRETLLDSSMGNFEEEVTVEPTVNDHSAPLSPPFQSSRPASSQLVDRYRTEQNSIVHYLPTTVSFFFFLFSIFKSIFILFPFFFFSSFPSQMAVGSRFQSSYATSQSYRDFCTKFSV